MAVTVRIRDTGEQGRTRAAISETIGMLREHAPSAIAEKFVPRLETFWERTGEEEEEEAHAGDKD